MKVVKSEPIKIFFACTFHEGTAKVVDRFFRRFRTYKHDLSIEKWRFRETDKPLLAATKKEIMSCDAFVGVITEKSLWPTIEAAIHTVQSSKQARKHTFIFVEKSVGHNDVFRELTPNVWVFDKALVSEVIPQVDFVVADLLKLLDDYVLTEGLKRVRIFLDGSGAVTYIHKLRVSARENARVKVLPGRFYVTDDVIKRNGFALPPVEKLIDPRQHPFRGPSFTSRILSDPLTGGDPISIVRVSDSGTKKPSSVRDFRIVLDRWLAPTETLEWAWGFTFPKLYKLKGSDSTIYNAHKAVPRLSFEVAFETERTLNPHIDFEEQPCLFHYDNKGNEMNRPKSGKLVRSIRYNKYIWEEIENVNKGERIEVRWKRSARKKGYSP